VILLAKGSKDEAYFWSSNRKEQRMVRTMKNIDLDIEKEKQIDPELNGQTKLLDFPDAHASNPVEKVPVVSVYVDQREIRSHVAHALESLGSR